MDSRPPIGVEGRLRGDKGLEGSAIVLCFAFSPQRNLRFVSKARLPKPSSRSVAGSCEVLVANDGVRNIIRRNDGFLLRNVITTGKKLGMIRMAHSVNALLREKVISTNTAESVLTNYRT